MFTLARRFIPLTALIAVFWAQAFGMNLGYFCDCDLSHGGHFTLLDHCHGPQDSSTEDHHHDGDHAPPHQHHDTTSNGSHKHDAVVDTLVAHPISGAKVQPPAPSLCLLDSSAMGLIGTLLLPPRTTPPIPSSLHPHPHARTFPQMGNWPNLLAHSIVLRL